MILMSMFLIMVSNMAIPSIMVFVLLLIMLSTMEHIRSTLRIYYLSYLHSSPHEIPTPLGRAGSTHSICCYRSRMLRYS
jgi:hypothetical protein